MTVQIFPRSANWIARLSLIGLALAILLFVGLWGLSLQSPANTGIGRPIQQPLAFSHEIHAGTLGLDCRYCHTSVENSPFAGMPSTEQCMTCHSQIVQGIPDIEALAASLNSGTPIGWVRVDQLPDYVYFDHSAHVDGGIACETCHGRVDQMSVVYKTQAMTMQWCISCHSNPQPNVRPEDAVFTMGWQPSAANPQSERIYTTVETQHLTDCDVCHR